MPWLLIRVSHQCHEWLLFNDGHLGSFSGLASWINHFQVPVDEDSSDEDEGQNQGDIRYYVSEGGGMATSQVGNHQAFIFFFISQALSSISFDLSFNQNKLFFLGRHRSAEGIDYSSDQRLEVHSKRRQTWLHHHQERSTNRFANNATHDCQVRKPRGRGGYVHRASW